MLDSEGHFRFNGANPAARSPRNIPAYITNLRHGSFQMAFMFVYFKFQEFSWNIKLDILVKKNIRNFFFKFIV